MPWLNELQAIFSEVESSCCRNTGLKITEAQVSPSGPGESHSLTPEIRAPPHPATSPALPRFPVQIGPPKCAPHLWQPRDPWPEESLCRGNLPRLRHHLVCTVMGKTALGLEILPGCALPGHPLSRGSVLWSGDVSSSSQPAAPGSGTPLSITKPSQVQ